MEPSDIIALTVGAIGFVTGILGLIAAARANGIAKKGNLLAKDANDIASKAAEDARSATQDAFRAEARDVMNEALNAARMAFDESGREGGDQRSPRTVLSVSATSLREVADCLTNKTERSALEELAGRYRALSAETAKLDQVRERADSAPPEEYIGEADNHRIAVVEEATKRWLKCEKELLEAQHAARSVLAVGSRNDQKDLRSTEDTSPNMT